MGLLKDRGVSGHAYDGVLVDQILEAIVADEGPADVVVPDALPELA